MHFVFGEGFSEDPVGACDIDETSRGDVIFKIWLSSVGENYVLCI